MFPYDQEDVRRVRQSNIVIPSATDGEPKGVVIPSVTDTPTESPPQDQESQFEFDFDGNNEDTQVDTFVLTLARSELVHLRNLMSVMLPPRGEETVSQQLAVVSGFPFTDASLWRKVAAACEAAGVKTGDSAPDYGLAPAALPTLEIVQVNNIPADVA